MQVWAGRKEGLKLNIPLEWNSCLVWHQGCSLTAPDREGGHDCEECHLEGSGCIGSRPLIWEYYPCCSKGT